MSEFFTNFHRGFLLQAARVITIGVLLSFAAPRSLAAEVSEGDSDALFAGFENPPSQARPFVRWWWNGDKLSKQEIIRELDLLKDAGIGGVEINPIRFPNPDEPLGIASLEWLGDEWIEMFKTAVEEAAKRDIIADSIVGSGWPFGGRFLKHGEQTQIMSLGTKTYTGPATVSLTEQEIFDEVKLPDPPSGAIHREIRYLRLAPIQMDTFEPGITLDIRPVDGKITFTVPDGTYVLYMLVLQEGFQDVINGAPGSDGPVLNHYSQAAVRRYLDRMSAALKPALGDLGGHLRAMFCDSLELSGANWCDDMPEEFQKRRGYSLLPYLPFVLTKVGHMGNTVGQDDRIKRSPQAEDMIQRVRYDFCRTRIEIFTERFVGTFQQWCRDNHIKSRAQAYGRGYHPLEASMIIDIPECETWLGNSPDSQLKINKFVASGARFAGKRLVSCEEVTNTQKVFNATLEDIKITGDLSNLSGVTHSVLHGFNYSPPQAAFPGWVRYGTFFNERNPWWPYVRKWTDYKARVSWVLQNAEPQADIAILHPLADIWSRYGLQRHPFPTISYPKYQFSLWQAIHQNGSNCDYISETIIQNAAYDKSGLDYNGRRYKTLILMEVDSLEPETASALLKFAQAGGKIIFIRQTPARSPGWVDADKNDAYVRNTITKILEDYSACCRVVPAPADDLIGWFADIQKSVDLTANIRFAEPCSDVSQITLRDGNRDIFFIVNSNPEKQYDITAEFDVTGKTPWVWDPETGHRGLLPCGPTDGKLPLTLPPAGSLLLVFEPGQSGPGPVARELTQLPNAQVIEGPWQVELRHVDQSRINLTLPSLVDFKSDNQMSRFAGEIVYAIEFQPDTSSRFAYLDLGRVYGVSSVKLNGRPLGVRWYGRHLYEIKDGLKSGNNTLEISVVTTLGNYCKSLTDNPVAQRWTARQPLYSAGMIGPVRLLDNP